MENKDQNNLIKKGKISIAISPLTQQAYVGKLNKGGTSRLWKQPVGEKELNNFILGYLEAELDKHGGSFNRPFTINGKRRVITVTIKDE